MHRMVCVTDSLRHAHIAKVVPTNPEGGFKLVCTNSGEELCRGEEKLGHNCHRFVTVSSYDPIFTDLGVLEYQIEAQFNEKAVA